MNKRLISQILSVLVVIGGALVMFGWFLNISSLKSVVPGFVSMKFITALSFSFSGILLLILSKKQKFEISKYFILMISYALLLLMIIFLFSLFTGVGTGIESLFVKEDPGAVKTSVLGVPAVPTIVCFILLSLSGLIFILNFKSLKGSFFIEILILIIGGLAVLGYLFNFPLMYYSFEGFTPMALNTAILFVLIGISSILIGMEDKTS